MVSLDEIKKEIEKGKEFEEVLKDFGWKDFEDLVSEIFLENNFFVEKKFVFKTRKKYEIDIVARKRDFLFCIDCKKWKKGRYKKAGLKKAAKKQEERCKELKKFLKEKKKYFPLIVTLYEEEILKSDSTFFIPIWKLNNFLVEFEKFL